MKTKAGLQKMAHLGLRVFLKLRCSHRVQGKVRLDRPSLLVANHASHLDIAALFAALPISEVTRVRTAAARDTIYALPAPLVAAIEFMFGTYPFERKTGSHESLEQGASYLSQGYHLAIFPEGRRSDEGLGAFTPGFAKLAYATGAPVIPIRIEGAGRVLPRGKKLVQRLPLKVHFHSPLQADRSVPYEFRRQAYARLMEEAHGAVQS
jgi:1-acyl-sn-glycerol-3-phosphate acyltransferase